MGVEQEEIWWADIKKQLNSKLGLMHLWYLLQQKVYVFYKCMIFIHFRKMKVI